MTSIRISSTLKLNFSAEDDRLIEEVGKHPALYDMKDLSYKDQRVKDNIWMSIADALGRSVAECKKRWKNIKDCNDRRLRETNRTGSEAPPVKKNQRGLALQERLSFLNSTDSKRRSFSNVTEEGDREDKCKGSNDDPALPLNDALHQFQDTDPVTPPLSGKKSTVEEQGSQNSVPIQEDVSDSEIHPRQPTQLMKRKTNYRENLCLAIEKRSKESDSMIKKLLSKDEEEPDDIDLFFKSISKTVKKFPPELQQRAKLQTLTQISNLELEMWSGKKHPNENQNIMLPSPTLSTTSTSCSGYMSVNRPSTCLGQELPEELFGQYPTGDNTDKAYEQL